MSCKSRMSVCRLLRRLGWLLGVGLMWQASLVPAMAEVPSQRGQGQAFELLGTEVWQVPDPVSKRDYQVFVSLPKNYQAQTNSRYPVLYVSDADYAFPVIRQLTRRLNGDGPEINDYILVGLSYGVGDDPVASRRRDYTPSRVGAKANAGLHGESAAYRRYLREQVLPFMASHYRTDEKSRWFVGHSYGSLLGINLLLEDPGLFAGFILGSPSLWYDPALYARIEREYANQHKDLAAKLYFYVGEYEDMKPGDDRFAKRYNMVTDTREFANRLRQRHYPSLKLKLEVLNDEDHLSVAPRGFSKGLKYLLGTGSAR